MGRLIDGMLALARASRGNMDRRTVDLGALAADVLARLREAEPDRDVTVRISEGMMVSGDPGLLRSLLENVLGNAWKYTGGQTNPCIEFTCEAQPSQVVFCVRDNGIGFDPAYADKLFVPFQRLHDAAEYQGEGIGLATAKRIVRRHGGEIWAEGAPGKGASFFFTLAT
jgi:hypothetical protein